MEKYKEIEIIKIQDDDCHWYWIPKSEIEKFKNMLSEIEGKDYMDCPDNFDKFNNLFCIYRTEGDINNVPEFYVNIKNLKNGK